MEKKTVLENEKHKIYWDFWDTHGSPNPGQKTRLSDDLQKRKKKKEKKTKTKHKQTNKQTKFM